MTFELILVTCIIGFLFVIVLGQWLEDDHSYSQKYPNQLPDGWVQVPDMGVWEKTSDGRVYQTMLTKHGFYTLKIDGVSMENFDSDSTIAALFHADQRIRFGYPN